MVRGKGEKNRREEGKGLMMELLLRGSTFPVFIFSSVSFFFFLFPLISRDMIPCFVLLFLFPLPRPPVSPFPFSSFLFQASVPPFPPDPQSMRRSTCMVPQYIHTYILFALMACPASLLEQPHPGHLRPHGEMSVVVPC